MDANGLLEFTKGLQGVRMVTNQPTKNQNTITIMVARIFMYLWGSESLGLKKSPENRKWYGTSEQVCHFFSAQEPGMRSPCTLWQTVYHFAARFAIETTI